jgi:class 3 adenylate cyclase
MGDGIMALFGAPIGHEDHAVRACYAALRMQRRVNLYADEMQQQGGTPVQIRVGVNSGEVVVRAIGSDLHMDYTAVGRTTHLAARMEQMAKPGSALITSASLNLAEGYVREARSLGNRAYKGTRGLLGRANSVACSGDLLAAPSLSRSGGATHAADTPARNTAHSAAPGGASRPHTPDRP